MVKTRRSVSVNLGKLGVLRRTLRRKGLGPVRTVTVAGRKGRLEAAAFWVCPVLCWVLLSCILKYPFQLKEIDRRLASVLSEEIYRLLIWLVISSRRNVVVELTLKT